MIIYVESKAFPYKSFVTVVQPGDKVARVRAQMLHILYEIGREQYQFRLRYNGQYMRDAFSLDEYNIEANAVIKMVPLSDDHKDALLYMHSLTLFLYVLTSYWYSVFWLAGYLLPFWYLIPGYTRIGGYIGNTFHRRLWFCVITGFMGLAVMAVAIFLAVSTWQEIVIGDVIERYLVQERDIEDVMKLARGSKVKDRRTAAYELATMAASSDDNKFRIVAEGGLSDLAHAARNGSMETQRLVSSIFLELEELLEILLDIPVRMMDKKLNLLAGKILLYFAENNQSRQWMLDMVHLKDYLMTFAQTRDPILQKVVVKVIFCMMDSKQLKDQARVRKLDKVLAFCMENSADRDVWDMADQGMQVINSNEDIFPTLPVLSTMEKLSMGQNSAFGSRASLRSSSSSQSSRRA
ncbi:hypothetical protein MAR_004060 [Mya arenaria]|uniref:Ubiquitin-like domain-containing protein n=1 Tax=Mya arenaria TaxID=6604 RepID=A0ABY7EVH2_MYAAR|nr:hypothetical protein MAR_004060 [Mya arenaria]